MQGDEGECRMDDGELFSRRSHGDRPWMLNRVQHDGEETDKSGEGREAKAWGEERDGHAPRAPRGDRMICRVNDWSREGDVGDVSG